MVMMGVYVSTNSGLVAFEEFLDGVRLGLVWRLHETNLSRQVFVLGDFNAHSSQWGNTRMDTRGRVLSDWAAGHGLLLLNRGSGP